MTDPNGAQSGTDPNAQSGGSGSTGTGAAGDGTQSGAGTGTGTTGTGTAETGQSANVRTYTEEEVNQLRARMQAADQRAAANEAQLKQIRDKDLPAIEKMTRDLAERDTQLKDANTALSNLRVENAFLTDNTHKWRNSATAMKLLDRSKVTVDSDGTVAGMKDALAALAKSDAYLLEPTVEGDGTGDGKGSVTPPLGTPPANGGTGAGGTTQAAMNKRFPALRTRIG